MVGSFISAASRAGGKVASTAASGTSKAAHTAGQGFNKFSTAAKNMADNFTPDPKTLLKEAEERSIQSAAKHAKRIEAAKIAAGEGTEQAAKKVTLETAEEAAQKAKVAKVAADKAKVEAQKAKADADSIALFSNNQDEIKAGYKNAEELAEKAKAAKVASKNADEAAVEAGKNVRFAGDDILEESAEQTAKTAAQKTGETAIKETAEEAAEKAAKELADKGFSPSQIANIQKSGLTVEEAVKLKEAGVKFAPKTFMEILKSPTTMTNAFISIVLGGGVAYYGAKAGENEAQEEAAANSSESSYKGADPLGYNQYGI